MNRVTINELEKQIKKCKRELLITSDIDTMIDLGQRIKGLESRIKVEKTTTKEEREEWKEKSATARWKAWKAGKQKGRAAVNRCPAYKAKVKGKEYPGSHRYNKDGVCYGCGHVETAEEREHREARKKPRKSS